MKGKSLIGLTVLVLLVTAYAFLDYHFGKSKEEKKEKSSMLFPFTSDEVEEIVIYKQDKQRDKRDKGNKQDKNTSTEEAGFSSLIFKKLKPKKEGKAEGKAEGKTKDKVEEEEGGKDSGSWHLQSPVQDLANQGQVKAMLNQLTREKYKALVSEGGKVDWSLYGLKEKSPSVFVRLSNGKSFRVFMGSRKNFQGSAFLKREVDGVLDKKVYTGTHAWSRYIHKELKDYRDRSLLREGKSSTLQKVLFFQGLTPSWDLVKKGGLWSSPSQEEWNLSSSSVHSELLDKLQGLKMDRVVSDSDPSPQEKKKWRLTADRRASSYRLSFENGTLWEAHFSPPQSPSSSQASDKKDNNSSKQVYVWIPKRKRVYAIAYDKVEKIQNLKLVTFRDRKEPFKFDKEAVVSISANWKLKRAEVRQEGSGDKGKGKGEGRGKKQDKAKNKDAQKKWVWYEKGKATGKKLDFFKIDDFVDSLFRLKVDEFLSVSYSTPPLPLNRSLSLKDRAGVLLFHLSWSEPFSKKVKGEKKDFVYARTNLIKDFFLMKPMDKLDFAALLPLPEEKKNPKDSKNSKEKLPISKKSEKAKDKTAKKAQKESS